MTRARRFDSPVECGITSIDRQRLTPVAPVLIFEQHGDRRADSHTLTNTRYEARTVVLDTHTSTTPISLLPAPQPAHRQAGGHQSVWLDKGAESGDSGGRGPQILMGSPYGRNANKLNKF